MFVSAHPPLLHHLLLYGAQIYHQFPGTGPCPAASCLPPCHQSLLTAVRAQPGRSIQPSRWPALNPELSHLPYNIIPREKGLGIGLGAFWNWSASVCVGGHQPIAESFLPSLDFEGASKDLRVQMGPGNHGLRDCQPQEKHGLF